jgi:hypothetical protein
MVSQTPSMLSWQCHRRNCCATCSCRTQLSAPLFDFCPHPILPASLSASYPSTYPLACLSIYLAACYIALLGDQTAPQDAPVQLHGAPDGQVVMLCGAPSVNCP